MKKLVALVLAFVCMFGLVACRINEHTCNPLAQEDYIELQPSTLNEPFITDEERNELLNKTINDYLDDLGEKSVSFTYEIESTQFGVYENKETIVYWVKIIYGEGFTTVLGFIIQ